MSKYGAVKAEVAGIKFDSRAEARRYGQLAAMERAGLIQKLERQVAYTLAPSVRLHGEKRAKPALRYVADFRYVRMGRTHVEDVKGVITPLFRVKQHLMKSVHEIDVEIVG